MALTNHKLLPYPDDHCRPSRFVIYSRLPTGALKAIAKAVSMAITTFLDDNLERRSPYDGKHLNISYLSNDTLVRRNISLVLYTF